MNFGLLLASAAMDGDERLKPPDKGGGEYECVMESEDFQASAAAQTSRKRAADNLNTEPLSKRTITDPEGGLGSESHIYKHPSLEINYRKYGVEDFGPFIVHVSRIVDSPNSGVSLKPIRLGLFLFEGGVQDIKKDGIKQIGRNRLSVEFDSAKAANEFLDHELLNKHKLKAEIPSYNVSRLGLVRGVPTEWTMEDFVNATEYKEGYGKIVKARRLSRKIKKDDGSPAWLPTQSVVLTFEGQSLPKKIFAYYTSLVVEVYQLPTIQCRKCLRFGHVQNACRSNARCYKCGQSHSGDTCNIPSDRVRCLLCTGRHFATDPTCPEFERQKRIKKIMSEHSISYMEASAQEPSVRRAYSDVAKTMFAQTPHQQLENPPPSVHSVSASTPQRTSYRKTVRTPSRARTPLSEGYNRYAHDEIIREPSSSLPNGCGLNGPHTLPNENLPQLLIMLITNIFAKFSDVLPYDVAPLLVRLAEIITNGSLGFNSNSSVEQ